jgi:hypothetical protein
LFFEITLSNLRSDGEIDERDFMVEQNYLCSLGQTVDFKFSENTTRSLNIFQTTPKQMGLAMGVNNLVDIFDEKYYRHLSGILKRLENYSSVT